MNFLKYAFSFTWAVYIILGTTVSFSADENQIAVLHPYIKNGGYALQINQKVVRSHNLNSPFVPASTIKILTGLISLEILGPEYRFATRFYIDDEKNLYIKGEGDPFFVSENITAIVDQLNKLNIITIKSLIFDESNFSVDGPPNGSENSDNPYDAHSGALAINFNALPFRVFKNGVIAPGEQQTPLIPMMKEIGKSYKKGKHRVNVSAFPQQESYSNIIRYIGEIFTATMSDKGITLQEKFKTGRVPKTAKLIYLHESDKTVKELVQTSLFYSSNFIANQLYLASGRRLYGSPATWSKSAKMTQKFIELRLKIPKTEIHMVDGSGLSPKNTITPAAMLTILNRFKPYASLLSKKQAVLLKSGTFTGAYCYAGYLGSGSNLAPFVLFLNQKRNTRKTILKLLQQEFATLSTK